ncbi:glycoside hydrolase family 3 protein [Halioglobus maricola]|nr:glycoside hydrolase family 3 protein [Halioglobus maricola]
MKSSATLTIEQCIALKLMVDIRLFDSGTGSEPVRQLPANLVQALRDIQPGGVILFRENLADIAQICELTAELRRCISPELLVGVDQEGGCVTRLPRRECTSFSGNMALAACSPGDRATLAGDMARAQAAELLALGINVNFVPSLDVNSNPANPVIHVRAFGDDPEVVAELGSAVTDGIQDGGVAASLKHFPGHGDTSQDSHTGLPLVSRSAAEAHAIDLKPFATVIARSDPAMVMTAHIQYPSLDSSTLSGNGVVRPATLSRRILTDLLRGELGFEGVVITDAMDMGAISQMLSPLEATLECFRAGADIALMPLLLRDTASLLALRALVDDLAAAVRAGELDEAELRTSALRVAAMRAEYALPEPSAETSSKPRAGRALANEAHRELEARIAAGSVTALQGEGGLPASVSSVHLLMPNAESASAMAMALTQMRPELEITYQSLTALDLALEREQVRACDAYVVGVSEPAISAVVVGGAEDLPGLADQRPATVLKALLAEAQGCHRGVVMLNSPYRAKEFYALADTVLASYDGAAVGLEGIPGPAYIALAAVLAGARAPTGHLPVSL